MARHSSIAPLLLLLLLLVLASPAASIPLVEPTAEQAARCARAPNPGLRDWCLNAYRVPALRLPERAQVFGAGSSITGMALFRPAATGPFPAIVLLHTCGQVSPQQSAYWTQAGIERGHAVLVLDSWAQRDLPRGGCSADVIDRHGFRARDAFDALAHLARMPEIDANRIAAMGFSQGGRIAYLAAAPGVAQFFAADARRFRAVVAVYGECYARGPRIEWLRPQVATPLLALLGDNDTDGDVTECLPRLEALRARGAPVEWHVFPGAAHGWDQQDGLGARYVPFAGHPSGMVLMQYDARVTAESRDRAFRFLAERMR
jgi:dienelactone hydrolase